MTDYEKAMLAHQIAQTNMVAKLCLEVSDMNARSKDESLLVTVNHTMRRLEEFLKGNAEVATIVKSL